MRHVPIKEFEINAAKFVTAAVAGEEILITQDGRDLLRLTMVADERMARQRAAVDAAYELGQEILRTRGPTTNEERLAWIKEDRR